MAAVTSEPSSQRVELTIPAEYLEDVRTALIEEINGDSDALRISHAGSHSAVREADRNAAMGWLRSNVELLDRLLAAEGDKEVSADAGTLAEVLQALARVLSKRLADEVGFAPVDMPAVLKLAEALQWAAVEANRLDGMEA